MTWRFSNDSAPLEGAGVQKKATSGFCVGKTKKTVNVEKISSTEPPSSTGTTHWSSQSLSEDKRGRVSASAPFSSKVSIKRWMNNKSITFVVFFLLQNKSSEIKSGKLKGRSHLSSPRPPSTDLESDLHPGRPWCSTKGHSQVPGLVWSWGPTHWFFALPPANDQTNQLQPDSNLTPNWFQGSNLELG